MYTFDVTNCDPRERPDCISVKAEIVEAMSVVMDENERLRAAINFCQKKL